jgi:hypothetical protein
MRVSRHAVPAEHGFLDGAVRSIHR